MSELDPLIHAPKRLRLMAILTATDGAEFSFLQAQLEINAPDLSKQMRALQDSGYVTGRKTGRGPGSTTWFRVTPAGRRAYLDHVAALRALIDAPTPTPPLDDPATAFSPPEASP